MQNKTMKFRLAIALLALGIAAPAFADTAGPTVAKPARRGNGAGFFAPFPFDGGEAIYKGVCAGCHMPDAKGAVGAGAYPALAKNEKLETAAYPISMVLKGQKAMPGLGMQLDDQQVADVVNYVRTNFGNKYKDKVKPADVKAMR
jgi:mono/diheme cytochrome c family protein